MNTKDHNKLQLDDAIAAMRDQVPGQTRLSAAADRVWQKLEAEARAASTPVHENQPIRSCQDFRSLIPGYRQKTLSPARKALLEDHTRECVACRKALWKSASREASPARPVRRDFSAYWKMGLAAAAVLVLAVAFQLGVFQNVFMSTASANAVAERLDGTLFRVNFGTLTPLTAGQAIGPEETVRTARGSRAILTLADGSRVEMSERSELSLEPRPDGASIALRQGSVIVRAAKQAEGRHLYVGTNDCEVAVKGTIFAVTSGTKGARVSVLEGEVWVEKAGQVTKLKPGEQVATHASISPVPLNREVAWSSEAGEYEALLRELSDVSRQLINDMANVPLRFDSALLQTVPAGTYLFASVPNVSKELADAGDQFYQRLQSNPELKAWWDQKLASEPGMPDVDEFIGRFRELGAYLGDELVVAVGEEVPGRTGVLLLARVNDAAGLRQALGDSLARIQGMAKQELPVVLVDDAAQLPAAGREALYILIAPDALAASNDPAALRQYAGERQTGPSAFVNSPFYKHIMHSYQEGVAWLFAADVNRIKAGHEPAAAGEESDMHDRLGLNDFQYVVVEEKNLNRQSQLRAALSFSQERRGIASWLGEPAPMGTLDFISADAYAAAAVVVKDPKMIVDELFEIMESTDAEAFQHLLDFQAEAGLDIRQDLADPLGGEFAFAIDGPILPKPAWKVIILLDDVAGFQNAMEKMVADVNRRLAEAGKAPVVLRNEQDGGRTYYTLVLPNDGPEAAYLYYEGYFLMAPTRAMLDQAITNRAGGYTLPRNPDFQQALPVDGHEYFSGLIYQNLQKVLSSLADYIPDKQTAVSQQNLDRIKETLKNAKPMVFCAYGEKDRIVIAGTGLLELNPFDMTSLVNLTKFMQFDPGNPGSGRGALLHAPAGND